MQSICNTNCFGFSAKIPAIFSGDLIWFKHVINLQVSPRFLQYFEIMLLSSDCLPERCKFIGFLLLLWRLLVLFLFHMINYCSIKVSIRVIPLLVLYLMSNLVTCLLSVVYPSEYHNLLLRFRLHMFSFDWNGWFCIWCLCFSFLQRIKISPKPLVTMGHHPMAYPLSTRIRSCFDRDI